MPAFNRAVAFGALAFVALLIAAVPARAADPCPEGMICDEVVVPADRSGQIPGQLSLSVRVTEGDGPIFMVLGGGPGQATTNLAELYAAKVAEIAPGYRLAVFDQRGTGGTAIRCPGLQHRLLTDFTVRPRSKVRECGRSLGQRRKLYSTAATVRDIEAVRTALGADRMVLMGISYGTYVAARYARAFPQRVERLILDSVLPQENVDPFLRVHMRRAARVLRSACRLIDCGIKSDPAADLHRAVVGSPRWVTVPGRRKQLRLDGPAILDWTTTVASFSQLNLPDLTLAFQRAARGNYRKLGRVGAEVRAIAGIQPAETMSWGLHAATLCSDLDWPFSPRTASLKKRRKAISRTLSSVKRRAFWPFDRRTAKNNGLLRGCLNWPRTVVAPPPKPGRLKPPTLLINGQYDLSTPVEYARRELKRTRQGRLIVVPTAGHAPGFGIPCASRAISQFLAGELRRNPCRDGLL